MQHTSFTDFKEFQNSFAYDVWICVAGCPYNYVDNKHGMRI